ncbi:MAG: RNase adapter RapZ [Pseudomonadota bacterium]
MRIVIVSGLSGSGRSVALHVLEDIGYFCIDNLPLSMLPHLMQELHADDEPLGDRVAIGLDARNRTADLEDLKAKIASIRETGAQCEILFLKTDDDTLLKRFSETRRKHPLAREDSSLRDAIAEERVRLMPVLNLADLVIDTTRTSVYDLSGEIRQRVASREPYQLSIMIESFGFKHGIPRDADYVFDLRGLPNPYWEPALREQTGLDAAVIRFFEQQPMVGEMRNSILAFLQQWIPSFENFNRNYLTIAVGCTGGQHRSVYVAEQLAESLRCDYPLISVRHQELISSGGNTAFS